MVNITRLLDTGPAIFHSKGLHHLHLRRIVTANNFLFPRQEFVSDDSRTASGLHFIQ